MAGIFGVNILKQRFMSLKSYLGDGFLEMNNKVVKVLEVDIVN